MERSVLNNVKIWCPLYYHILTIEKPFVLLQSVVKPNPVTANLHVIGK